MKLHKRYCLQELVNLDVKNKLEIWQTTKYCNDDIMALYPFVANGIYRIWDTVDNKVVSLEKH